MTNLIENPVYEPGVFQLETTTPVLGGPVGFNLGVPTTGFSNAQAQQLANRTAYLNGKFGDLADFSNPSNGSGLVGHKRSALTSTADTVGELLSAQLPNIWEFSEFVVSRPTPADPSTWDWTPAFQAVQSSFKGVYVPAGTFKIAGVRQLVEDFCITGESPSSTTLYVSSGVGIYDYVGLDTVPGVARTGLQISNLSIAGPYVNPDDFSSPANSWALASGLSKDLVDTSLVGIRLKRSSRTAFYNVLFTGLHVGIDQYGGIFGVIDRCVFDNLKIGYRCTNGASWGDAAFKTTTMRVRNNFFRKLWVGMYLTEWVDDSRSEGNIFEPANTATYVVNGGSIRGSCLLNDYYERCYEGVVFTGGLLSNWKIRDPYFAGTPGNFWGFGYSIDIQVGAGASFKLYLEARTIGGGGFRTASVAGRVIADTITAVGSSYFNTLYLQNFINKPLNPDPKFYREGRLIDFGAGIISKTIETDTDGSTVLAFLGSGTGLAFNGLRYLLVGKRNGPVRMRLSYKYTGTSVNFRPFGIFLGAPFSTHVGPLIAGDTGGEWIEVDLTATNATADYALAQAQGGFNGVLRIKGFFASEGYGNAENYPVVPNIIPDNNIPAVGKGEVGDRAPKMIPAVGSPKAWSCTVAGNPGTWVSEGNL